MQLHAFDSKGQLTTARQALRQINYYCLECQQIVRLRGGPQRQCHFYHLEPTPFCRQHQKGAVHLQLQSYFFNYLPSGDCQLEYPFVSIHRIADVAWLSQKIVFEIQYSAISAEEVLARNRDYQQEGWKVIWILHDRRYNQNRLSAAELALGLSPHFFSNMDEQGEGMIYDQFDIWDKGLRRERLPPLPIDLKGEINRISAKKSSYPLVLLNQRATHWEISFAGDLQNIFLKNPQADYIQQARIKENFFYASLQPFVFTHLPTLIWEKAIKQPYLVLFRFFLERLCR